MAAASTEGRADRLPRTDLAGEGQLRGGGGSWPNMPISRSSAASVIASSGRSTTASDGHSRAARSSPSSRLTSDSCSGTLHPVLRRRQHRPDRQPLVRTDQRGREAVAEQRPGGLLTGVDVPAGRDEERVGQPGRGELAADAEDPARGLQGVRGVRQHPDPAVPSLDQQAGRRRARPSSSGTTDVSGRELSAQLSSTAGTLSSASGSW